MALSTNRLTRFRAALKAVPQALLVSPSDALLIAASEAIDRLESAVSAESTVVLTGASGVGKSYLFNALVGSDVARSDVLRPTTRRTLIAGHDPGYSSSEHADVVRVPGMASGFLVVDTPPWDFDRSSVELALRSADFGVLVVSPSRYGDATSTELWHLMEDLPERLVVVNRLPESQASNTDVIESVADLFDSEPAAVVEGGDTSLFVQRVLSGRGASDERDEKMSVDRLSAQQAGQSLATALTASAADLASLGSSVSTFDVSDMLKTSYKIQEDWLATREMLMQDMSTAVEVLDSDIVAIDSSGIALRVLTELGEWDGTNLASNLDRWRVDVAETCRGSAVVRWRKVSTFQELDQASWQVGVDTSSPVTRRVKRAMKSSLESAAHSAHEQLSSLMDGALVRRLETWSSMLDKAGRYKPGELLVASNGLSDS